MPGSNAVRPPAVGKLERLRAATNHRGPARSGEHPLHAHWFDGGGRAWSTRLWIASLEDLIVAKLEWARLGGSARQIEDVANLVRVAGPDIDRAYLEHWIDALGLGPQGRAAELDAGA
jgi:hypothetical protein